MRKFTSKKIFTFSMFVPKLPPLTGFAHSGNENPSNFVFDLRAVKSIQVIPFSPFWNKVSRS